MSWPLKQLGAWLGIAVANDAIVTGVEIDSRAVVEGNLFLAFHGEKVDGHDYVDAARERGAVAAIVERPVKSSILQWVVPDVLEALQILGRGARTSFAGEVVAVTGSAGKTSTKEIIAHLIASEKRVTKSTGNLNNHLGVPLSLLRMDRDADVAVLELGMNHAGEIAALSTIARPTVGVVTNVGYAHIENFDSQEGIAKAKRELIEGLEPKGIAVLNADDEWARTFGEGHQGPVVMFGMSEAADVRATNVRFHAGGATFDVDGIGVKTKLIGRLGASNVLAGMAVGKSLGVSVAKMAERALTLEPAKMRGERIEVRGMTVWNDCYNSNPDAAKAMLEAVADVPAARKIAVLGEMLELGRWAEPLHREVGKQVARCGFSVLVGIRGAAQFIVMGAREAGLADGAAFFFESPDEAGRYVREIAQPGDALLFKGSRGVRVELALDAFLGEGAAK